ncbi:siderophore-interacting protein [Tessaracoccus antarcticus]|uniref:Siderophore-interacting protein n=1 Tax=Tessaracoccus antarcticus TaxID=2479848 RepID=A0A3M0GE06_9ACTN|nr:siderophore-interacting protein [Tessaracoccus antarcticus]RMB59833.1 siderophore-interacting protein [Tessaracoccus antarcticus]
MTDQVSIKPDKKAVREAEVVSVTWLTPGMVRLQFSGDALRSMPPLEYTDHYVKFFFPPLGATYSWPFDQEQIRATLPREQWPVTRTYTIRSFDRETNVMTIDFVVHGADGLAGPWAASVEPGARIGFRGPGGKFMPDPGVDSHLLVGDEAAVPAIARTLEALPQHAVAEVFVEVDSEEYRPELPTTAHTTVNWIHRKGHSHGVTLAEAVRNAPAMAGTVQAFVHGNAHMVKDLRRYLFVERGMDKSQVSISGYWRTDYTEDAWQASKNDFVAAMEAEEAAATP